MSDANFHIMETDLKLRKAEVERLQEREAKLMQVIELQNKCIEFYAAFANGENNQPIFDDENSNRAQIYEKYKQYSIGDLGVKAVETKAESAKLMEKLTNEK